MVPFWIKTTANDIFFTYRGGSVLLTKGGVGWDQGLEKGEEGRSFSLSYTSSIASIASRVTAGTYAFHM